MWASRPRLALDALARRGRLAHARQLILQEAARSSQIRPNAELDAATGHATARAAERARSRRGSHGRRPNRSKTISRPLAAESEEVGSSSLSPGSSARTGRTTSTSSRGCGRRQPRFAELPRRPVVLAVTPLWNTPPRLLQELILSVRCQSWLRWELILVDDGSQRTGPSRGGAAVGRVATPGFASRPAAVNGGSVHARNQAIALASGDFLAILDHDDLLASDGAGHLRAAPVRAIPT